MCYSNLNKNRFNQETGARTQNQNTLTIKGFPAETNDAAVEARLATKGPKTTSYNVLPGVNIKDTLLVPAGVGSVGVGEQALLGLPGVAGEQALHLGDIVKSRRARGTPK